MNIAVRYYTRSGNTKKLAEAVAQSVGVAAEDVFVPLQEKADILLLGCSYYGFDMDENVKKFILDNKEKIGKIACFGTSAMMSSMKKPLKKVTEPVGLTICDEEFHCRGSFGPFHKEHPNEKDLKQAAAFAKVVTKQV